MMKPYVIPELGCVIVQDYLLRLLVNLFQTFIMNWSCEWVCEMVEKEINSFTLNKVCSFMSFTMLETETVRLSL